MHTPRALRPNNFIRRVLMMRLFVVLSLLPYARLPSCLFARMESSPSLLIYMLICLFRPLLSLLLAAAETALFICPQAQPFPAGSREGGYTT